jgi:hypothetical protein
MLLGARPLTTATGITWERIPEKGKKLQRNAKNHQILG